MQTIKSDNTGDIFYGFLANHNLQSSLRALLSGTHRESDVETNVLSTGACEVHICEKTEYHVSGEFRIDKLGEIKKNVPRSIDDWQVFKV